MVHVWVWVGRVRRRSIGHQHHEHCWGERGWGNIQQQHHEHSAAAAATARCQARTRCLCYVGSVMMVGGRGTASRQASMTSTAVAVACLHVCVCVVVGGGYVCGERLLSKQHRRARVAGLFLHRYLMHTPLSPCTRRSSRSHAIFTITIQRTMVDVLNEVGDDMRAKVRTQGVASPRGHAGGETTSLL